VLLLLLAAAPVDAVETDQPRQLAGLFMQGCVAFVGNPTALRAWARRLALVELPAQARETFLHGASGTAFDASNPGGKFVLLSADDGSCAALTDTALGPAVIEALEADLAGASISARLLDEQDDKEEASLRRRDYAARLGTHAWRIRAATVKDGKAGPAMLYAHPE
jgi:hypothetical protein